MLENETTGKLRVTDCPVCSGPTTSKSMVLSCSATATTTRRHDGRGYDMTRAEVGHYTHLENRFRPTLFSYSHTPTQASSGNQLRPGQRSLHLFRPQRTSQRISLPSKKSTLDILSGS